jgi:hypothetical protein
LHQGIEAWVVPFNTGAARGEDPTRRPSDDLWRIEHDPGSRIDGGSFDRRIIAAPIRKISAGAARPHFGRRRALAKLLATGKLEARRKSGAPLASKSTLNRLEHAPASALGRYHKISHAAAAIEELLVALFPEAHATTPERIALDLDATDHPLPGHQEGRFFHGYYDDQPGSLMTVGFGAGSRPFGPRVSEGGGDLDHRQQRHLRHHPDAPGARLPAPPISRARPGAPRPPAPSP